MKYLLDTHAFFWAAFQDEKLPTKVKTILEEPSNEILVSQVSILELAIKYKVGKLPELKARPTDLLYEISRAGFSLLPLRNEHLTNYFDYPYFSADHKDPFDRLLLVIAGFEKATFITKDEKFDAYKGQMAIFW